MNFFLTPTDSPQERRRLRTVWRFLIFAIGYIMVQIIVAIGVAVVWIGWLLATGNLGSATNPATIAGQIDEWLVPIMAISSPPVAGLTLGLCLLCRRFLDRRTVVTMGLVRPIRGLTTGIVPGFLFGLAPIALASLGLCAAGGFRFEGFAVPMQALYMAPAFVFAAFHEEIIFRGYLFQNLIDIRLPVFGILFTSILFWLMHSFNPGAWGSPIVGLNLFGAGVLLALAYQLSQNIWFPTALHFGWNLGQGVVFSIPVSGMSLEGFVKLERNSAFPPLLTGGEFGLEGSLVITALELVMILILVAALHSRQNVDTTEPRESAEEDPAIPD